MLQTKLNLLYESIDAISNAKNIEDTLNFTITEQEKQINELLVFKLKSQDEYAEIWQQKTLCEEQSNDINQYKKKIEKMHAMETQANKKKIQKLEGDVKRLRLDLDKAVEDGRKADKQLKQYHAENQRMRQRINRLR